MLVSGALFAGNYFGGDVLDEAEKLFNIPNWSGSIQNADTPDIWSVVNDDGSFGFGYNFKTFPFMSFDQLNSKYKL